MTFVAFHPEAWARGGDVDAAFGSNGVMSFPGVGDNYFRYQMAGLVDGRVLVAHSVSNSVDLFMIRPDGTFDPAFGQAGILNIPGMSAAAIAEQPDGRILVAGGDAQLTVLRLFPNGSVDTSFGVNGRGSYAVRDVYGVGVQSLRVLPDGSIIVAALPVTWPGPPTSAGYMSLVKLTRDGAIDTSYGAHGIVDHAFGYQWSGSTGVLRILDDGSVEFVQSLPAVTMKTLRKSRLRADGSLDTSFGTAGVLTVDTLLPPDPYNLPISVAILDDGSILAYKIFAQPNNPDILLKMSRYSGDFALDRSFGVDGIATLNAVGSFAGRAPDGGYVFVGGGTNYLGILKATARGEPDTSFGANGVATVALPVPADAWRTSLYWPKVMPDGFVTVLTASVQLNTNGPWKAFVAKVQAAGDLVEFRNGILNHYFVTYDGDEARGIDAGVAGPGWSRTGGSFRPGGSTPVCRFYGTPGVGPNSHFFTASADECEAVKHAVGWTYEGLGFYTTPPTNGQCAAGLQAVHRLYNNRAAQNDSNHRFTADPAVIAAMQAQGWVHEGVVFCAKT